MKGRDGRLTKKAIEKLKKNYGKAVRNNVNRNIASTSERDSAVKKMQVGIKAGLYHCLKISNQERHKYCPVNSWCKFKKGLPCPNKPHHLNNVFKKPLEKIYDRLSEASDACLDTPRMQMSLSMHLHGTSVPSLSGMEEIELSWLHPLPLCTSVVVQQKSLMS